MRHTVAHAQGFRRRMALFQAGRPKVARCIGGHHPRFIGRGGEHHPGLRLLPLARPRTLDQLLRDLRNEPGGLISGGAAKDHAAFRVENIELLFGARDRHISQAALFFNFIRVIDRLQSRENPLFKSRKEYYGEFQALRGMHGHHNHRIRGFVEVVDIRHQGDLLEEPGEACLVPVVLLILDDIGRQFVDVVDAVLRVVVFGGLQRFDVIRPIQDEMV